MIKILIDDESLSSEIIEKLISMPSRLHHIEHKLDLILQKEEKIMAEIDDLQAALDAQSTAIGNFNTTLQSAVEAINTEIAQLAAAVQSATDLAQLKAAVTAATGRVTTATDGISSASATLQTEIDALNADNPPA